MNATQKLAWVAGLGAVLLNAGCASVGTHRAYRGAERAPAEVATVWGSTNQGLRVVSPNSERLSITAVDDHSTVPWYSLASFPRAVSVIPGKHKLGIRYEYIHGVADGAIWVDARAGRTYQAKVLNPDQRTERVYFVIHDITAQSIVGGAEENTRPDLGAQPQQ